MSGSGDKTIQLWDAQTGGQVGNPLQGHGRAVTSVAFSPDGRHIISGSLDTTLQLWDVQTGSQVGHLLPEHRCVVFSVAFSPDGKHIVSGSMDHTVRLWNVQTDGQMDNPSQEYTSSVISVAFSPDGRQIVSGSLNKEIQLQDAQAGNVIKEKNMNSLSCTLSPIHLSSSATHALHDFVDISNVNGDFQDLIHLQNDGWIVGQNGQLLLWVPPSYHKPFSYTPWTHLVLSEGGPELDLSKMVHGPAWHECYTPVCKCN